MDTRSSTTITTIDISSQPTKRQKQEAATENQRAVTSTSTTIITSTPTPNTSLESYLNFLKSASRLPYAKSNSEQARQILEMAIEIEERSLSEVQEQSSPEATHRKIRLMILHNKMAHVFREMGDWKAAIEHHNRAVAFYRQDPRTYHVFPALAINNLRDLASIHLTLNSSKKALKCYQTIYTIQEQQSAGSGELAETVSNMGYLNYLLERYPEAMRCYQEELQLRLATGNRSTAAIAMNTIGMLYYKMEQLEEAERAFQCCVRLRQSATSDDNDFSIDQGNIDNNNYTEEEEECKGQSIDHISLMTEHVH